METSELETIEGRLTECIEALEIFLVLEISEMQRQLDNLRRINVQILSKHILSQSEKGVQKEKSDLIKNISNIIRD